MADGLYSEIHSGSEEEQGNKLDEILRCLTRHQSGDYGALGEEDITANKEALINGDRLLSKYITSLGSIYIITEWDRSSTCIMFCWEY
ncbi:MAG: hypothetical protein HUJ56_00225 [Erysipelotrichaceae bacterium]|nr:hypothetical protein [Erysipelotrichaceae bacterium]